MSDVLFDRARVLVQAGTAPAAAFRQALAEQPQAAEAWHRGEDIDATMTGETVDPGQLLLSHAAALGQTFAESARAFPALAAAWHAGELVEHGGAPTVEDMPATPAVERFRAALAGDQVGATLRSVPLFRAGTWNGKKCTIGDLDALVNAANAGHFDIPVKLGHDPSPAVPAVGRVVNVRRQGDVLLGDMVDL